LRIVRAGLPEPKINLHVPEARYDGIVPMVDLAYPEFRVGIEYEGDHHRQPVQFRRDIRRYERFADAGWSIVRVTGDDVPDGSAPGASAELLARIEARLRARGWRP
jgi:very-short-patch-repair endonuclease